MDEVDGFNGPSEMRLDSFQVGCGHMDLVSFRSVLEEFLCVAAEEELYCLLLQLSCINCWNVSASVPWVSCHLELGSYRPRVTSEESPATWIPGLSSGTSPDQLVSGIWILHFSIWKFFNLGFITCGIRKRPQLNGGIHTGLQILNYFSWETWWLLGVHLKLCNQHPFHLKKF